VPKLLISRRMGAGCAPVEWHVSCMWVVKPLRASVASGTRLNSLDDWRVWDLAAGRWPLPPPPGTCIH
jgi:hypothetical protein